MDAAKAHSRNNRILPQSPLHLLGLKRPDATPQSLLRQRRPIRLRNNIPRHEQRRRRLPRFVRPREKATPTTALAGSGTGLARAARGGTRALDARRAVARGGGREQARDGCWTVGRAVSGCGFGVVVACVVVWCVGVVGGGISVVLCPEVFDFSEAERGAVFEFCSQGLEAEGAVGLGGHGGLGKLTASRLESWKAGHLKSLQTGKPAGLPEPYNERGLKRERKRETTRLQSLHGEATAL